MTPQTKEGIRRMNLLNVQQCSDAADALYYYVKHYYKYLAKLADQKKISLEQLISDQ